MLRRRDRRAASFLDISDRHYAWLRAWLDERKIRDVRDLDGPQQASAVLASAVWAGIRLSPERRIQLAEEALRAGAYAKATRRRWRREPASAALRRLPWQALAIVLHVVVLLALWSTVVVVIKPPAPEQATISIEQVEPEFEALKTADENGAGGRTGGPPAYPVLNQIVAERAMSGDIRMHVDHTDGSRQHGNPAWMPEDVPDLPTPHDGVGAAGPTGPEYGWGTGIGGGSGPGRAIGTQLRPRMQGRLRRPYGMKPTFLGQPIDGMEVVFVIDRSGSMNARVNVEKVVAPAVTGATLLHARDVEIAPQMIARMQADGQLTGIDWSQIETRWDLAREALVACLRMLTSEHAFTIVVFSEHARAFHNRLVIATPERVEKAIHWIREDVDGPANDTNYSRALREAFDTRAVANSDPLRRVSEIVLLSDGEPDDAVEDLLDLVAVRTRRNEVRISPVIVGPNKAIACHALAKATGGTVLVCPDGRVRTNAPGGATAGDGDTEERVPDLPPIIGGLTGE